jgi:formylglycine-generating enzyme required for sulfatase activity
MHAHVIAAAIGLVAIMITGCAGIRSSISSSPDRLIPHGDWVMIPSGSFQMGDEEGDDDEEPVHEVLLDAYWITRYEITNHQYLECVDAGVCSEVAIVQDGLAQHPVVNVNWGEAQDFCAWVGARLPTEAEWEKAARGGLNGGRYPWGKTEVSCDREAKNGAQFGYCSGEALPVGSFPPNGYGLHDMAGNAWEWVADWYDENYYQVTPSNNPTGPEAGIYKIMRGGAWNYTVYGLRVAYRSVSYPESRANFIGFRCARTDVP